MLVILLTFPAIAYASARENVAIKSVYFKDEKGRMVYVNYKQAIEDAMDGKLQLYNAIKEYVGEAEEKGRNIYIETNTEKIYDYRLAMIDGLFRLEDIIGKVKYEVSGSIEYTHVLIVEDGVAKIVPKETVIDPPEDPVYIVDITPVRSVTVDFGTPEEEAIRLLPNTTTIRDSEGGIHTVELSWTIDNYNGNIEGEYTAIGTFELPAGIENQLGLTLKVTTMVIVASPWPEEVESVVVGVSAITEKTYVNINIKDEFVSEVEAVYVKDKLANQVEGEPFQWRIEVEEGTTVNDLKGKVVVQLEGGNDDTEPEVLAMYYPSYLAEFGMIKVEVNNVEEAAKFSVVYHLADNDDGTKNIVETEIANIGREVGLIFYDLSQYHTVDIKVFDADNNLLNVFEDVIPVMTTN